MTPFWAFLAASAAAGVLVWAGHRWVTRGRPDTWPAPLPDWSDADFAVLRGDLDEPELFDSPASGPAPVSPVRNRGAA